MYSSLLSEQETKMIKDKSNIIDKKMKDIKNDFIRDIYYFINTV